MKEVIIKSSFVFGLCFLALMFPISSTADTSDGNVLSVTKIQDNGPDNQRFNIIIMGDGYQTSEIPNFETHAQTVVTAFNNQRIYGPCGGAVNFYRVNIESDDSGVDKPETCYGTAAILRDTYLDSHYCAINTKRCIWSSNLALVESTASNACAIWHFIVVLVNDTEVGGCAGGNRTFISTGAASGRILIHELGHAIGGLGDEYEEFTGSYTGSEPDKPNLTSQTTRAAVKWFDLIAFTTPVPTWDKGGACSTFSNPPATWSGIIGTYEGGGRLYTCGIYRPVPTCLMRSSTADFCAVCVRSIQQVLMEFFPGSNLAITPWGYYKDPKTRPHWQTPDIWCDNNGNNIQEAGEPSIGKSDNHLFARVTNNGDAPSEAFQVRFSYVPYTAVIDMADEILITTISRPSLAVGATDVVEVLWDLTSIPPAYSGVDHFCLIVQIIADECATYDNMARNNFWSVPTVGSSPAPVSFYIKNILDVDATGEIIIEPKPPVWQYTANVLNLKEIPLRPKEEKLIIIEFKYVEECKEKKDDVMERTDVQSKICAQQQFDISFKLNGQLLGGVSTEVIVYHPPEYKYSVSLHFGITSPLSDFDSLYNGGIMFGLDVDYHFTPQLSLQGLLAYNSFKADSHGIEDTHWWNISVNLKYELGLGLLRSYVNGGCGVYIPKTGSASFGANFGAGMDYIITHNLVAEVGANYHRIFTENDHTEFLVTHVGVILRF